MPRPWIEARMLDNPSDPYAEYAINSASYILWALSGRKYSGISTTTEQYSCASTELPEGCSWDEHSGGWFNPVNQLTIYNAVEFAPPVLRRGGLASRFRLRNKPVRRIESVTVGDTVLDPAGYSIVNNAMINIDGRSGFGLCDAPVVTYSFGVNPPDLGVLAAIKFANELLAGMNGQECGLPSRVTSVQRQGISFDMYDPQEFLDKGRIGVYEIDMFISAVNPYGSKKPARVLSPDTPRARSERRQ